LRRNGVVYEVPCSECDHVYVRETGRTLEKRLSEHRTAVRKNELRRNGVVYEVPCSECNHVYIRETGRTLEKHLSEHRAAVRKNDRKNRIAVNA